MPARQQSFDHQVFTDTLARLALTEKVFDSHTVSGLVLAILSAPEQILPSEWFPLVFIDESVNNESLTNNESPSDEAPEPHQFQNAEEANDFYSQLLMLWNDWVAQLAIDEPLPLPAEYGLEIDGQPTLPFQAFCSGVIMGYGWLEESWGDLLDGIRDSTPEVDDVFGSTLAACLLIREPEATRKALLEMEGTPLDEQMSLQEARELLPVGLQVLASIGREVAEALMDESEPADNPLRGVGRNDPSPCGSGKKYKHCCLH